jgi:hypothetical protein
MFILGAVKIVSSRGVKLKIAAYWSDASASKGF